MSEVNSDVDRESRPGVVAEQVKRGSREGIALCLSGGGFRASLFHLGSLRWLNEAGILPRVRMVSSVSGGSILAGYLAGRMIALNMAHGIAFNDWNYDFANGFREVAKRDLRTWPFLAHILWNWALPGYRVRHLERRYQSRLTGAPLGQLPGRPEFVFCATDLAFGVNWEFRRERSGDYLAGSTEAAANWPIARAVAASACFPPIFGPMPLGLKPGELQGGRCKAIDKPRIAKIGLSDGGVYDNMALEPAWKHNEHVLVSDCGAPFEFGVSRWYVRRLLRYSAVVMNQAAAMRKRAYFADIRENDAASPPRYRGAYWGIGGAVEEYKDPLDPIAGYSQALVDEVISRVRTDLDRFTDAEICVLENHGYLVTAAVMRRRRKDLVPSFEPAPMPPHAAWMDEGRVRKSLAQSHKRFSLRRMLNWG